MVEATVLICYKQADQQTLYLVLVTAHDIKVFVASKAFAVGLGGQNHASLSLALNTFTKFYLND